ncbi:MAG: DNA repair protein RecO, partial [Acidobacteriota bacterium]
MAIETEAYVLRVHPMGESDRIVVLLSPREGKLRGVARHAALSRRRFGGSLSFLSQVRVRFVLKPGRDLVGLESCELVAPTPGEGRDLQAFYVCAYLAEILDHFSHEGQADESLYRLTRAVCQALSAGGSPVAMARYFEVWTLRLAGLLPALQG